MMHAYIVLGDAGRCSEEKDKGAIGFLLSPVIQEEHTGYKFRRISRSSVTKWFVIWIAFCATFTMNTTCRCAATVQKHFFAVSKTTFQYQNTYGSAFGSMRSKVFMRRLPIRLSSQQFGTGTALEVESPHRQHGLLQDMLYRVRQCNHIPPEIQESLVNFYVDNMKVGKMSFPFAEALSSTPLFEFLDNHKDQKKFAKGCNLSLSLTSEAGATEPERTAAVQNLMQRLSAEGLIEGWRDEYYPVVSSFDDAKVPLLIERAAAPHFGIQQYGVHINGYVRDEKTGRPTKMWLARRSYSKSKYPGMLDHIVAGGQPHGISPMENVVKECNEEAGIPYDLARKASPAGAVSYEYFSEKKSSSGQKIETIERSCLFCYDLELPADFEPIAVDGEVEEFFLWDLDKVAETMSRSYEDPIKPNCYLVIIDFLLRWGYITPESPGYLDLLREIRSGQCS